MKGLQSLDGMQMHGTDAPGGDCLAGDHERGLSRRVGGGKLACNLPKKQVCAISACQMVMNMI